MTPKAHCHVPKVACGTVLCAGWGCWLPLVGAAGSPWSGLLAPPGRGCWLPLASAYVDKPWGCDGDVMPSIALLVALPWPHAQRSFVAENADHQTFTSTTSVKSCTNTGTAKPQLEQ